MKVRIIDKDQHPLPVLKQKPPSIQQRYDKNKSINIVSLNVRTLRVKREFTKVIKGPGARPEDKKVFLMETMIQNQIDIDPISIYFCIQVFFFLLMNHLILFSQRRL